MVTTRHKRAAAAPPAASTSTAKRRQVSKPAVAQQASSTTAAKQRTTRRTAGKAQAKPPPSSITPSSLVHARTYGNSAGARRFRALDSSVLSSGRWARALSPERAEVSAASSHSDEPDSSSDESSDEEPAREAEEEEEASPVRGRRTTRRKAAVKAKASLSSSLDSLPPRRRRHVSAGSSPSPGGAPPSIFSRGSHSPSLGGTPRTSPIATPQKEEPPRPKVRQSVLSEETLRALKEAAGDEGEEEEEAGVPMEEDGGGASSSNLGPLAPLSGSSVEEGRVARLPRALRALRPARTAAQVDKGKGKAPSSSTPSLLLHSPHSPQRSTARTPADSASIHERPRSSMKPYSSSSDYTAGREALVIVNLASQGLPRQEALLFSSARSGAEDEDEDDLPHVDELNYVTPIAPDSSEEEEAEEEHQEPSSAESSPASPLRAVKLRTKVHPPSSPPARATRARTRSGGEAVVPNKEAQLEPPRPVYKLSTKARLPATSYYARAKREEGSPTPAVLPPAEKAALLAV